MQLWILVIIGSVLVLGGSLLGVYIANKRAKTSSLDWEIGGRALPLFVVVGTQFASNMGGGVLVGHVGNAYNYGLVVMVYAFLTASVFIFLIFMAKWLRSKNFTTVPEILTSFSNNNKIVKLFAGLMTIFVPLGWLSSQLIAFGKLYSQLTPINYNLLVVIMAILSILFVMPAGLKTVAWTDFIFSCFMIFMCIVSILYAFNLGGGYLM